MTKKQTLSRWRVASKPKANTEKERQKYLLGVAFYHHYNAWYCDHQAKNASSYDEKISFNQASNEHRRLWHEAMEIACDLLKINPWDIWEKYEAEMAKELHDEGKYEIQFYVNALLEIASQRIEEYFNA